MKKFLILMLTAILTLSLTCPAWAGPVYPDVKAGHWAEKDIAKMKAKGIVAGFADGYHPQEPVSREQAIVMLIRVMGKGEEAWGKKLPGNFKKPELLSVWSKESVALAAELGMLGRQDLENFRPKEATKRYEMAIFVAKALGYQDAGSSTDLGFADEKDIPAEAKGYIAAAKDAGVLSGLNDNTFRPNESLSRAQMASLLASLDNKLNKLNSSTSYGQVFSISTSSNAILVKDERDMIQTIPLAKNSFIYKGKAIALTGLVKGDRIQIICNDQGEGLYVEEVGAIEVPVIKQVRGEITLITRASSVTLRVYEENGTSNNYTLSTTAQIIVDGLKSDAERLAVGQSVNLTLSGNQITKIEATSLRAGEQLKRQTCVIGEIISLDKSGTIQLKLVGETAQARVWVDFSTFIIKLDQHISFSSLQLGDRVVAAGKYEGKDFIATALIVLAEIE